MDDVDDPYYDPDDPASDHLLFDAGLSVLPDAPEFVRAGEIPEPRAARFTEPSADERAAFDDAAAAAARERSAARRAGRPVSGDAGGDSAGVRRVHPSASQEPEREPRGGAGDPGRPDPSELEEVRLYLAGRGRQGRHGKQGDVQPSKFAEASFIFEMGDIKINRAGAAVLTLIVPFDAVSSALALRTSYGILLEAKVKPVKRKAP